MSATKTRPVAPILAQEMALGAYLDALLCPAPAVTEDTEPAAVVAPVQLVPELAESAVPVTADTRPAIAPPLEPTPLPADSPASVAEALTESEPEPAPAMAPMPAVTSIPEWAQGGFQCLMFKVGGLSLAVPLARLHGVSPWNSAGITPMPGHAPWFLGLLTRQEQQVKVVDTALLVVPEERRQNLVAGDPDRLGHVIYIDDGRWGLACDCLGEVVTLSEAAVKWRGSRGKRPWLAGTVIEHMCALLDTEAFAGLLRDGDSGHVL